MTRALAAVAILCGALLIFGGLVTSGPPDRLRLSSLVERRMVTVIVTVPHPDERYRYLSVHGCSAVIAEHGVWCSGDFERESSLAIGAERQHLITWRDLPRGSMLITAVAFDARQAVLARGELTIFRGE